MWKKIGQEWGRMGYVTEQKGVFCHEVVALFNSGKYICFNILIFLNINIISLNLILVIICLAYPLPSSLFAEFCVLKF